MKNRLIRPLCILVMVLCAYMLTLDSNIYTGIGIGIDFIGFFFNILFFCTISIFFRKRPYSLLFEESIVRTIRIGGRKKCLLKELLKVFGNSVFFVSIFFFSTLLFAKSGFYGLTSKLFWLTYFVNCLIVFILMFIQLNLELHISRNFGFYVSCVSYVLSLLVSPKLYEYQMLNPDLSWPSLLNKLNYTNIMSVKRMEALGIDMEFAIVALMGIALICIFIAFLVIKNLDVIDKE